MSATKTRFRPTVQTLESRRYLAGDLGLDEFDATPEEPARDRVATITEITISGNTANKEGGGLWNDAGGTMTVKEMDPPVSRNVTITGSTISGNTANSDGGGVVADSTSEKHVDEVFAEIGEGVKGANDDILAWSFSLSGAE